MQGWFWRGSFPVGSNKWYSTTVVGVVPFPCVCQLWSSQLLTHIVHCSMLWVMEWRVRQLVRGEGVRACCETAFVPDLLAAARPKHRRTRPVRRADECVSNTGIRPRHWPSRQTRGIGRLVPRSMAAPAQRRRTDTTKAAEVMTASHEFLLPSHGASHAPRVLCVSRSSVFTSSSMHSASCCIKLEYDVSV